MEFRSLPAKTPHPDVGQLQQLLESAKAKGIGHEMSDMQMQKPVNSPDRATMPSNPSTTTMPGMKH